MVPADLAVDHAGEGAAAYPCKREVSSKKGPTYVLHPDLKEGWRRPAVGSPWDAAANVLATPTPHITTGYLLAPAVHRPDRTYTHGGDSQTWE